MSEVDFLSTRYSFCISGKSTTGKSFSLAGLEEPEKWCLANCEGGKGLPFSSDIEEYIITDPLQVWGLLEEKANDPDNKGFIIDTLTFLLDMFESQFVYNAKNGRAGWGSYQQFMKQLVQDKIANYGKPVIILAHTQETYNEEEKVKKTTIPVKGGLKYVGLESYFTTVVATKVMDIEELKGYENPLLNITEEEMDLGFKNVFQTRKTRATKNEAIRSPYNLFSREETFIDNNAQSVVDRLIQYYN